MKDKLLVELTQRGWSVTRHAAELPWWAEEIWSLESIWAPSGYSLHLTFLTDQQPGSTEPFLEVGTCSHWPANRDDASGEPCLAFRGWVPALPQFIGDLDRLRAADSHCR